VATGEAHSVQEFVEAAFGHLGLDWQKYVEVDSRYLRPTEVSHLLGNAQKAQKLLGWKPRVTFDELVRVMVDYDLELARQEQTLRLAGHEVADSEMSKH
jgi:GDPmannose 4,6-dehydratase